MECHVCWFQHRVGAENYVQMVGNRSVTVYQHSEVVKGVTATKIAARTHEKKHENQEKYEY